MAVIYLLTKLKFEVKLLFHFTPSMTEIITKQLTEVGRSKQVRKLMRHIFNT